jgi:3-oxoacyl-[acyl-carrier protein] reductase
MMADLSGKVALITGASRGIGQAISLILGKNGATVIGTATSDSGADAISKTFQENSIVGKGFALNVTENDQIENLMKSISDEYGSVDILVNNAGITRDNLLMRMKDDEWNDIMNTNLASVYKMSKAVLRGMMKKKNGRIISIASVVGAMGNAGQTNYSAAKAGIMGFTKSLAREVGPRGITVNAIAPGFIKTDMTDALPEEQKEFLANQIPLGRLGTVDEIAESVLFLAGNSGAYITAQTLHVNGGMYTV